MAPYFDGGTGKRFYLGLTNELTFMDISGINFSVILNIIYHNSDFEFELSGSQYIPPIPTMGAMELRKLMYKHNIL